MKILAAAICIVMALPPGAKSAPNDGRYDDEPKILSYHPTPRLYIGAATVIVASSMFDETIREHLFPWRNADPSEDLRRLGDAAQIAGPVIGTGFLLEGVAAHNQRSKDTAILAYETWILAGAICGVGKFAFGRRRPETTDYPYHFRPSFKDSSFPSGHTTEAFAAATVFSEQYPHWYVAVPAYGAAATVGFSRMYASKHWLSDVLGGAFLGTVVSHELRVHMKRRRQETAWRIESSGSDIRFVRKF